MKKIFFAVFIACAFSVCAEEVRVVFRTAPSELVITKALDGTALKLQAGSNGSRTTLLPAGAHALVFSAEGYASARLEINISAADCVVEVKLERAESVLKLSGIADTDKRPKSVAYTPDGRYLVVAPLSASRINIFDAETLTLAASPAPPQQWARHQGFVETAFPPGRREIWVSQMYTNKIHIFSLNDFTYLRTVSSGGNFPKVICPHFDGRVFVSNWLSETVSVLSPDGSERLASIRTRGIPRGLAISPDGTKLYAANFTNGTVEVFDAYSYKPAGVLFNGASARSGPAGGAKRHLIVDPVLDRLYVSDMARSSVFVYDVRKDAFVAEIRLGSDVKTNTIALSPDGRYVYVSTRGPNNAADYELKGPAFGELIVIDTKTLAIVERHWGGNQPTGLSVSPSGAALVFSDFLDHRLERYTRPDYDPRPDGR